MDLRCPFDMSTRKADISIPMSRPTPVVANVRLNSPTDSCIHIIAEQQVTLYPHRDQNNEWRIVNATGESEADLDWSKVPITYLTPGTRIKLRHISTDKHLHSHDVRPPISDVDFQNEVSAYGMKNFAGDANDDWILEIDHGDKKDPESGKRLRTLRTVFKLKHALTGCYLFSHKVKLPDWGFEQQEVTCNKNAVKDNSLWYVETAMHEACELCFFLFLLGWVLIWAL